MKRSILISMLLGLMILLPTTWLLNSEGGLRWAYQQLQPRLPAELQLQQVSGTLGDSITLLGIEYIDAGLEVRAERLLLQWNPWALLSWRLEITRLELDQVDITLPPSNNDTQVASNDTPLPEIVLPLQVSLQQASSDRVSIRQGNHSLQLQDSILRARTDGRQIIIERLDLRATDIVIAGQAQNDIETSLSGWFEPTDEYHHDLLLDWRTRIPAGALLVNELTLKGDIQSTQLVQTSSGPLRAQLSLQLQQPLQQLSWQASLVVSELDTGLLDANLPALRGSLNLSASGDLTSAQVDGEIDADSAQLGKIDSRFRLRSLEAERLFDGLQIESLKLAYLDGNFDSSGQLLWAPTLSWNSDIDISHVNPAGLLPEWHGDLSAKLHSEGRIEDEQLTASVEISESSGQLRDYPFSLQGAAHWQKGILRIESANLNSGASRISTSGSVGDQIDLQWSLDSRDLAELYPQAQGQLLARGHLGGTRDAAFIEAEFEGQSLRLSDYSAQRLNGNIAVDLMSWQKLDLRLVAQEMTLQGQRIKSLDIITDARHIEAKLVADGLQAQIRAVGEIRDESWSGQLLGADIDSVEFKQWHLMEAVDLQLSAASSASERLCLRSSEQAEICAKFRQNTAGWDLDLELARYPLPLLRRWTPAGLELDGVIDAVADMQYSIEGSLLGTLQAKFPQASASYPLQGETPERFDYRLASFDLTLDNEHIKAIGALTLENGDNFEGWLELPGASILDLDLEAQLFQAAATITASNWPIVDSMIPQLRDLRGNLDLELAAHGSLGEPRLKGSAQLRDGGFHFPAMNLEVTQIELNATSDGSEKIDFDASAAIADGQLTLRGDTTLNQKAGWPGQVSVSATGLQISQLLASWVEQPLSIDGRLAAEAELTFRAPDLLFGKIEIAAPKGALNYPLVEQEIDSWPFKDGSISINLSESGIDATSGIDIGKNSTLKGTVKLDGARLLALDFERQNLLAEAHINFDELELIEFAVTEIDQVTGRLEIDLSAAGSLAQPQINVRSQISKAAFRVPPLGLQISDIEMLGDSDNFNHFNFTLSARSGEGSLDISGSSELKSDKGWPTAISVKGSNFEVLRIPEAQVTASPDLQIKLQNRSIDISGDLIVPFARLQPRDVSTAQRVSRDSVIIGEEQAPQEKWLVTTRINLSLGERVTFYGFGFESRLGGNLLIEDKPGQLSIGTGEITILEGRYRAYGQRLDTQNGRLLFTGSPLDNPGLDLRAVREVDNITVGLEVRGRLQQPQIELFSIPTLGQTDMLSYLLLGRPMEGASGDEGEMMAEAALALGLAGGDSLARLVGDSFGLDEVRVESGNSGDQASLVVGRYLSPKLYVSYGVGLIDSINTLNLRYKLTERWQLEAESGEYQGADLLYSIER